MRIWIVRGLTQSSRTAASGAITTVRVFSGFTEQTRVT